MPGPAWSGRAYWERVLNGLVYELNSPEQVHACLRRGFGRQGAGRRLFDLVAPAALPDVTALPEPQRLPRLRQLFETLQDGAHPLRLALEKLSTLDTVRIIEGKTWKLSIPRALARLAVLS